MAKKCAVCKYSEKVGDVYFCNKQDCENYGYLIGDGIPCADFEENYYCDWKVAIYRAIKGIGGDNDGGMDER